MGISNKGLDLIKAFEGCKLKTYRCPANVATIGYGTTRYPDGRKVQMEDRISEQQAEAFLIYDCDEFVKGVEQLVQVPLNQNQTDALISFTYNVGLGAFANSTLLTKLNQGDYQGAANEFPRWNKITVRGVKQESAGLTRRRAEEKALFEMVGNEGEIFNIQPSAKDTVTWLELYRTENGNSLVAAWNGEELVELVALDRAIKEDLASVLVQYKNAKNVHIAPADKAIPDGEIIIQEGSEKDLTPPETTPPDLGGQILRRGSEGKAVEWLQARLGELGYYNGEIDGDFGHGTDDAVRCFQAAVFGSSEADGKVGPITLKALLGDVPVSPPVAPPSPGSGTYLRLTKTNKQDQFGLYKLRLAYIKNGQEVGHIMTCSGTSNNQKFRIGIESRSGSMEPLPEGKWYVHDMHWKGGRDNYQVSWKPGLGPVKIWLEYKGPKRTERSEIMIHMDWNRPPRGHAPGTAGCIGVVTIADFKKLATWLRDSDPRDLYVDWGLGTCPKPTVVLQTITA